MEPSVITGLDAIGRGQDLQKLMTFANSASPAMQYVQGSINWDNFVLRVAEASGIDTQGLLLTPQERQQAQRAAAMQQATMAGAQAAGESAGSNLGTAGTQDMGAMAEAVAAAQQQAPQA